METIHTAPLSNQEMNIFGQRTHMELHPYRSGFNRWLLLIQTSIDFSQLALERGGGMCVCVCVCDRYIVSAFDQVQFLLFSGLMLGS